MLGQFLKQEEWLINHVCSGNEIGPFRAIEESTLAQLTPAEGRSDIYAWYSLLGTAGTAYGMILTGWILQFLRQDLHWGVLEVYRLVYWVYAALGIFMLLITLLLSPATEAEPPRPKANGIQGVVDPEREPLLPSEGENTVEAKPTKKNFRSFLPQISPESRAIVLSLCLLFGLDSFASGLSAL